MRTVVCDIETDSLNPTKIWCAVAKDTKTHELFTFIQGEEDHFRTFARSVNTWIGHNFLVFDRRAICNLWGVPIHHRKVIDTLVCSRLFRSIINGQGHSLEDWGRDLGFPKGQFHEFDTFSPRMLEYCINDVELNHRIYQTLKKEIFNPRNQTALRLEHDTALICEELNETGFGFDAERARNLLGKTEERLQRLTGELQESFPPKATPIKEVHPKATKGGNIHRGDFRWLVDGNLDPYSVGASFTRFDWVPFNPGSHKQVVSRLNEAGWNPTERTKGYYKARREGNLSREMEQLGWKVNEANLDTIPETAPQAARKLAEWLMIEGRRRTLEEWLAAYNEATGRIHGRFFHIGPWTHRKSHANPNMANAPAPKSKAKDDRLREIAIWYGKKMRSLYIAEKGWRLLGVDADGIQLRILSHLMEDEEFQNALVNGSKTTFTDAHSVNARVLKLGQERREEAKTWIYMWVLGGGLDKSAEILHTDREGAAKANELFLDRYPKLREFRDKDVEEAWERGWIELLDGRRLSCKHPKNQNKVGMVLGGLLQGNESVIMKWACRYWREELKRAGLRKGIDYRQVNDVHDEWQTEVRDDVALGEHVKFVQTESIRIAGEVLGLKCPLLGNGKFGKNWYETH